MVRETPQGAVEKFLLLFQEVEPPSAVKVTRLFLLFPGLPFVVSPPTLLITLLPHCLVCCA